MLLLAAGGAAFAERAAPKATTVLRSDSPRLDATLEMAFPTRRGLDTVVEPRVLVDPAGLVGPDTYVLDLVGEISRTVALGGSVPADSFRYRFELPASDLASIPLPIPLVVQRPLLPGTYNLILRVKDPVGGGEWRIEQALEVPATPSHDPHLSARDRAPSLADALADIGQSHAVQTTLALVLPAGEVHTGVVRIEARISGEAQRVGFEIDGRSALTRSKPPYAIEVDLGPLPRKLAIRATAYAADGGVLARTEHVLNGGPHRFTVHLVEPIAGARAGRGVPVVVTTQVPTGRNLDRIELFRGDQRVVTLFDPPFEHLLPLDGIGDTAVVRALGVLDDGSEAEDAALINGPMTSEVVAVDLVEVYATVVDRRGRPVTGLEADAFTVLEENQPQTLRRFEQVHDLPVHATILLDTSASMAKRLVAARDAATRFFEQVVVSDRDEVALIAFNDRPQVIAPYTHDRAVFAAGIESLAAARSTALYDSLIYALYYQGGLSDQRALLVISDGEDEISRHSEDEALEYARRARVTLYTVGLDLDGDGSRRTLTRLAEETGGRSFFVDDTEALDEVYRAILDELRSRYLLVYQSPGAGRRFRRIDVRVTGRGLKVRALRGYYPQP
jgi:Ca-activated chloride channel family protein